MKEAPHRLQLHGAGVDGRIRPNGAWELLAKHAQPLVGTQIGACDLGYLAERDVDFAYWPLNGLKYSEPGRGSRETSLEVSEALGDSRHCLDRL